MDRKKGPSSRHISFALLLGSFASYFGLNGLSTLFEPVFARAVSAAVDSVNDAAVLCPPHAAYLVCGSIVNRNVVLGTMNAINRVVSTIVALFAGYLLDKVSA